MRSGHGKHGKQQAMAREHFISLGGIVHYGYDECSRRAGRSQLRAESVMVLRLITPIRRSLHTATFPSVFLESQHSSKLILGNEIRC